MNPFRLGWDLVCLFRRVARLDRLRLSEGPRRAVEEARLLGHSCRGRLPRERRLLQRQISLIDRLWRKGPNCYRRVLLEISMDRGAADEIVRLGFRGAGGEGSGHAWLGGQIHPDGKPQPYDAIVSI